MERLTDRWGAAKQQAAYSRRMMNGYPRNIPEERYLKLAAYENAEEDGEMLWLLCKVGAPVWFVVQDVDDPGRWEICEPQKITEVGTRGFWISGLLDEPDGMHMFTPWSALGSEAFLSREAAETALEEREDNG